jgi:hypothetical protein
LSIAHPMVIGMVSSLSSIFVIPFSEIPNILVRGTLHLHFSTFFYLHKDTNPSLAVFDKNAEDLDMVTCYKWTHSKLDFFHRLFQASHKKLHCLPKIIHSWKHMHLVTYL